MKDIKLFVVTHKGTNINYPGRIYIHVGSGEPSQNMLCDNLGNNIAAKNKNFCELTAVYWIWKNISCDIVGIEHYRRIFGFNFFDGKNYFILNSKKIEKKLNKYDIICPKKVKFNDTLLNCYNHAHDPNDIKIVRQIIDEKYPEYSQSFDIIMNSDAGSMYNMMICKKEMFDSYCSWLFDILFESEKFIDPTDRDAYQARVFGFLSERLLNVWLHKNKLMIYYASVVRTDKGKFKAFIGIIKDKIKRVLSC